MTKEEIKQDLASDRYINPFKAKEYINFLLSEHDRLEEGIKEFNNEVMKHLIPTTVSKGLTKLLNLMKGGDKW